MHHPHFRPRGGFTLVEIMIVVAIIALLAAIALPSFLRARIQSQNARWMNDSRVASDAFTMYAAEYGVLPPDGYPGQIPAGMAPYFGTKIRWLERTPIGGEWDWDGPGTSVAAFGVATLNPSRSPEECLLIDRRHDDGSLDTGRLRYLGDRFTWIME